MQNNFNIGDYVKLIEGHYYECSSTNSNAHKIAKLKITMMTDDKSLIRKAVWIDFDGNEIGYTCCNFSPKDYIKVSANNLMNKTLITLPEEQKEGLSPEDQALVELGVVNDKLQLIDKEYVITCYFKANKSTIAKQAVEDVKKIKAELKKAAK